jgi:hypothetical protein
MCAGSFLSYSETKEGPGNQGQNPHHIFTVKTPVCPAKEKQEVSLTVQSRNVSTYRNINMRAGYPDQQGMLSICPITQLSFLRTTSRMGDTRGPLLFNVRGVTSLWMFLQSTYLDLPSTVLYLPYPESRSRFLFDLPL